MRPTGNLREFSSGASRAQIIVVTKCPQGLTKEEKQRIRSRLELRNYQKLFFSYIDYNSRLLSKQAVLELEALKNKDFCVVTGIANPKPLLQFLQKQKLEFKHLNFGDHHNFSEDEIRELNQENFILTTEKDYVRLQDKIDANKLFYLPIKSAFLDGEDLFQQELLRFVNSFK
jgi:tetraacyldisaccharide 4'-kinase